MFIDHFCTSLYHNFIEKRQIERLFNNYIAALTDRDPIPNPWELALMEGWFEKAKAKARISK